MTWERETEVSDCVALERYEAKSNNTSDHVPFQSVPTPTKRTLNKRAPINRPHRTLPVSRGRPRRINKSPRRPNRPFSPTTDNCDMMVSNFDDVVPEMKDSMLTKPSNNDKQPSMTPSSLPYSQVVSDDDDVLFELNPMDEHMDPFQDALSQLIESQSLTDIDTFSQQIEEE